MIHCGSKSKRLAALVALVFVSHAVLSATSTRSLPGLDNDQIVPGLSFLQRSNVISRRVCQLNGANVCSLPLNIPLIGGKHRKVTCHDYAQLVRNLVQGQKAAAAFYGVDGGFAFDTFDDGEATSRKRLPSCNELLLIATGSSAYAEKYESPYRESTRIGRLGCAFKSFESWCGCRLRKQNDECSSYQLQTKVFNVIYQQEGGVERKRGREMNYDCNDIGKALGLLFPHAKAVAITLAKRNGWAQEEVQEKAPQEVQEEAS